MKNSNRINIKMKANKKIMATLGVLFILTIHVSAQDNTYSKLTKSEFKDEFMDVGGYKLQYRKYGKGDPTIVFLNGGSAKMNYWNTITPEISQSFSVLTYERAGHDKSEMGRRPRHGLNIALELKVLLEKLNVPEPYIVVAHSAGCMYARIFVAEYPEAVAGMILLDPGDKDFLDAFGEKYLKDSLKSQWNNYWDETWNSLGQRSNASGEEIRMKDITINQMLERKFPADLILYIVSGMDVNRPSYYIEDYGEEVVNLFYEYAGEYHKSLLNGLKYGKHIPLYDARHVIHHDRPDVVISLIRDIVSTLEVKE